MRAEFLLQIGFVWPIRCLKIDLIWMPLRHTLSNLTSPAHIVLYPPSFPSIAPWPSQTFVCGTTLFFKVVSRPPVYRRLFIEAVTWVLTQTYWIRISGGWSWAIGAFNTNHCINVRDHYFSSLKEQLWCMHRVFGEIKKHSLSQPQAQWSRRA